MNNKVVAIGVAVAMFLSGCASYSAVAQPGQAIAWTKDGVTEEQARKDKYECEKDPDTVTKKFMAIIQQYYARLAKCYEMKGYTVAKRAQ